MGRWLARLKKVENDSFANRQNCQKPINDSSVSIVSNKVAHITKKIDIQKFIKDCINGLPVTLEDTLAYFKNDLPDLQNGSFTADAFKFAVDSWVKTTNKKPEFKNDFDNRVNCADCLDWDWRNQQCRNAKHKGGKTLLLRRCNEHQHRVIKN